MGLASRTPWWAASPQRIVTTIEADHPAPRLSWRLPTAPATRSAQIRSRVGDYSIVEDAKRCFLLLIRSGQSARLCKRVKGAVVIGGHERLAGR
jgi:hypothetical protein